MPDFMGKGLRLAAGRSYSAPVGACRRRPTIALTYDPTNVFARILRKEIPAELLHEDEFCVAFRDANPQAPVHLLVIPKRPIAGVAAATPADREVLGHLMVTAADLARAQGFADGGYRLVVNNGAGAGQTVFHLHVHVLAGRSFAWPPG